MEKEKDIKLNPDVSNEPVEETVSNENIKQVEEWKAPTKEEYEKVLKSTTNKAKTEILKDLGVDSIKSFKIRQAEIEEQLASLKTLKEEYENTQKEYDALKNDYTSLKKETILREFNVAEDYREDLIKLADAKVTEDKPFEDVVKELVEGRYKYTVERPSLKMGTEKTSEPQISSVDKKLQKKYPWIR